MKAILVLGALLYCVAPAATGQDTDLKTLVADLPLQSLDNIQGTFEQTRHISVLTAPLTASGEFSYQREQGVVWRTLEPVRSTLRVDANDKVTQEDANGTVQQVPASDFIGGLFKSLFSGDFSQLGELFQFEQLPVDDASERDLSWRLRLTPRQAAVSEQLQYIDLAGDGFAERVVIQQANGDRTEIALTTDTPSGTPP